MKNSHQFSLENQKHRPPIFGGGITPEFVTVAWLDQRQNRVIGPWPLSDILIEETVGNAIIRVVVDAKHYESPIDVKDVESFLGVLADVNGHKGMMVSLKGYTAAALQRAWSDPADVDLDVLSLDELKELQGYMAIPFSGRAGIFIRAPFGWIVDATRREGAVACLYRRGFDLAKAQKSREWMYINFWHKREPGEDLASLCRAQDSGLITAFPDAVITYLPGADRSDAKTTIRKAEVPSYPAPEFTGFVEFGDFIFFCVMFSPVVSQNVNLRKLRGMLREALPLTVSQAPAGEGLK